MLSTQIHTQTITHENTEKCASENSKFWHIMRNKNSKTSKNGSVILKKVIEDQFVYRKTQQ